MGFEKEIKEDAIILIFMKNSINSSHYRAEISEIEDLDVKYKVPENIAEEVRGYLDKIKKPDISKEEWLGLMDWMRNKEAEDLNYKLARLEMTLSPQSMENARDPENLVHVLNDLRIRLQNGINIKSSD